jgi:TRAP-type C4-dicarboxylate transport system permease small subunit
VSEGSRGLAKGAAKTASAIGVVVGVALFAAMFATFIAGVVMRYAAGRPLTWSDEVCVVLLLWSTFWAAAFVVRHDEHVTFDILYDLAPSRGRRLMALVAAFGFGALLLAALPATYGYVAFLWRETTPTLRLRLDYVYACFPLFIAVMGARLLWRGQALARRGWERWV